MFERTIEDGLNEWVQIYCEWAFSNNSSERNLKTYLLHKESCIPFSIYRYRKWNKFTIDEITNGRIFLGSPLNFNDLLEGFIQLSENAIGKIALDRMRKNEISEDYYKKSIAHEINRANLFQFLKLSGLDKIRDFYRVACFSENNTASPMWAHYGDNNKGVCLEYSLDSEDCFDKDAENQLKTFRKYLYPISYQSHSHNGDNIFFDAEMDQLNFFRGLALLLKKGPEWGYEEEWRLILKANSAQTQFVRTPVLKSVIAGPRMSPDDLDELNMVVNFRSPAFGGWKPAAILQAYVNPDTGRIAVAYPEHVPKIELPPLSS